MIAAGASGGGFHALLMLGSYPGLIQGASIWVPIYYLALWYFERPDHRDELETCFGGPPTDDASA